MQRINLGDAITATGAGTATTNNTTPFLPGVKAKAEINCHGLTGQAKLQHSDDNSSWSDVIDTGSLTTRDDTFVAEVTLKKYVRRNLVSRSAGNADFSFWVDV